MKIIYASGVLEEVSEAANFYEDEVEGLGKATYSSSKKLYPTSKPTHESFA